MGGDIAWSTIRMFIYNFAIQHVVCMEGPHIEAVYAVFRDIKLDLLEKWNVMQRVRTVKRLSIWQHQH